MINKEEAYECKFYNTALVSVIIPCYNLAELRRTFKSVCKQSCKCWEAICVDDGSDMELFPVIKALDDPRIPYCHLKAHTNANVARNCWKGS